MGVRASLDGHGSGGALLTSSRRFAVASTPLIRSRLSDTRTVFFASWRNVFVVWMRMAPMRNGIQNTMPRYTSAMAMPAALETPKDVNATSTAASTTPTPCGVMDIMANSVATT